MMQGFYWDVTPGGVWYDTLAHRAEALGRAGFTGIWLPPPSKGGGGGFDVGYTPYDYYDLGEFDSWPGDVSPGDGSAIPTRYGTRTQLENAIGSLQDAGMRVYMDIVLNHRSGGVLEANPFAEFYTDRSGGSLFSPDGDSTFTAFPLTHGSGRIAWPEGEGGAFFFPNNVRNQDNTFDFFSDSQIAGFHQMYINAFGYQNALHDGDGSTLPVGDSLKVWGDWLTSTLGIDGYRFDFVKGIHPEYLKRWVDYGANRGRFHVHELYDGDIGRLKTYLDLVSGTEKPPAIFDFNIRFAYKEWSDAGAGFDVRTLHSRGLYNHGVPYHQIVPFAENHDFDRTNYRGEATQEGHSPIIGRKNLIYAHLLTHPGYAQVWWRDYFYYGLRDEINLLMAVRRQFASGGHHILTARDDAFWPGHDAFGAPDFEDVYVMQRDGTDDHTGLIVSINNNEDWTIDVWVTNIRDDWRGRRLIDLTGNVSDTTQVFYDSRVLIRTAPNSYSVWVPEDYQFVLDTGVQVAGLTGLLDDYFVDEEVLTGVELLSEATLSQEITVALEVVRVDGAGGGIGGSADGSSISMSRVDAAGGDIDGSGGGSVEPNSNDGHSVIPKFISRDIYGNELAMSDPMAAPAAVAADTITVTLQGGDRRSFDFAPFSLSQPGLYTVTAHLVGHGAGEGTSASRQIEVLDPDTAPAVRVDGRLTDPGYRLMATRTNTNAGFGPGKTVDALYFYDDADSVYIGIDGEIVAGDQDAIGVMLDFSGRQGVAAGQPLGGVPGAAGFLAASGDQSEDGIASNAFTMDFDADLGLTIYTAPGPGGTGTRFVLSMADYSGASSGSDAAGIVVLPASESAADGGDAVSGPAADGVFPAGSVRYAVINSGRERQGVEIAIAKDALGLPAGSGGGSLSFSDADAPVAQNEGNGPGTVRGLAFIVSNTAYFSNVTVPGNVDGDADDFGNAGFGAQFHELDGGPFVSPALMLGTDEQPLATPLPVRPAADAVVGPEFELAWRHVPDASQYRVQAGLYLATQDAPQSGFDIDVLVDEITADSLLAVTADSINLDTDWLWRVQALDPDGGRESAWTNYIRFRVAEDSDDDNGDNGDNDNGNGNGDDNGDNGDDDGPLPAASLISPVDEAVGGPDVLFAWSLVSGAESYRIQAASSSGRLNIGLTFLDEIVAAPLTGTQVTWDYDISQLDDIPTEVHWRVRAAADGRVSPWSQPAQFSLTYTDTGWDGAELPDRVVLEQNYPNPFNPATMIRFGLPSESDVRLEVYSLDGRMVARLVDTRLPAGFHNIPFDASQLSSGMYLYRLVTPDVRQSGRMLLVK